MIRLSLTKADVTGPPSEGNADGIPYPKVTVLIRNDRLVIQSQAGVTMHEVAATGARGTGAKTWEIDTAEGIFHVVRRSGCGCR